jgi:hypothetical protein
MLRRPLRLMHDNYALFDSFVQMVSAVAPLVRFGRKHGVTETNPLRRQDGEPIKRR